MTVTVHPGVVRGRVPAPGSKSVTHRALFLAMLCGCGTVRRPLWSADTLASLDAIRQFGAGVVATHNEAVVRLDALRAATIDAKNSGTTLRLATGVAALAKGRSTLSGDASLVKRPMGPLAEALAPLGASAECLGADGRPPVVVTGPAVGGVTKIRGDVSSQFISSLIMAGMLMPRGAEVELTSELTSAPYVRLTRRMMHDAGLTVEATDRGFSVPHQEPRPVRIDVAGDYSAAAFPLVAAAVSGGDVTVTGLPPDSGQGDEALVSILAEFGCEIERDADTVRLAGAKLRPGHVSLKDNPDLFPALCVLATACNGKSVLHGAPHLRHKESDRIAAMTKGLQTLGVKIAARDDGAEVTGGPVSGGTVDSLGDHRIQMAFAIAALGARGPVTIEGPDDAHAVSYPPFFEHLRALGAEVVLGTTTGGGAA